MKAMKLFVQLTIYYVVVFGGAWLLVHNNPGIQSYLPIGGAQDLINSGSGKSSAFEAVSQAAHVTMPIDVSNLMCPVGEVGFPGAVSGGMTRGNAPAAMR